MAHVASVHVPRAHSGVTFQTELQGGLGEVSWLWALEEEETDRLVSS